MKYWTLFTLRMIARVGLAAAVLLWIAGQFKPTVVAATHRGYRFCARVGADELRVTWINPWDLASIPTDVFDVHVDEHGMWSHDPGFQMPGVSGWAFRSHAGGIRFSHWLLCLAFLLATVATRKRQKSDVPSAEPVAASEP